MLRLFIRIVLVIPLVLLLLASCGEFPRSAEQVTPTTGVNLPIVSRPGVPTPAPTATAEPTPGAGRPWLDTTNGIYIFNDQLALYDNAAWTQFAATHYAGTQKMTRADADALRVVNPDFLILHYRLGIGLGYRVPDGSCQPTGGYLQIIDGDWVQEWPGDGVVQPEWFFSYGGSPRVYQCDWGWYLMEPDNASWRAWWSGEILRQLQANDDDGLFADSVSVPNYMGGSSFSPPLPDYDPAFEAEWTARLHGWMDYVRAQFAGHYVLIPNAGSWVNGRDATDYSRADGVMIEGFGYDAWSDFSADDWRLQMDRVLSLVQQGKVILAQSYYADTPAQRLFTLGSYLLLKGTRTYVNLEIAMEPEWWPEYEIPLGAYVDGIPASMDALYVDGVYQRAYANGLVLVNPGAGDVTVALDGTYYLAQPTGGGVIPDDGQIPPAWTVSYTPVTQVTLSTGTAAILVQAIP